MKGFTTMFLSPQNLVKELDSVVADEEGDIELSNFRNKTPRKNPKWYEWFDECLTGRASYDITQTVQNESINAIIFGFESTSKIGRIKIEQGLEDDIEYETLQFWLKTPLELKNGQVLPKCYVEIHIEYPGHSTPELWVRYQNKRFFSRETPEVAEVLPLKWFLAESYREYIEREEAKAVYQ